MTNQPTARIEIRLDGHSITVTRHDPGNTLDDALDAAAHPQTGNMEVRYLIRWLAGKMSRFDLIDFVRRRLTPDLLVSALDANLTDDCLETSLKDYEPRFKKPLGELSVLIQEMRQAREADLARQVEEIESGAPAGQSATA